MLHASESHPCWNRTYELWTHGDHAFTFLPLLSSPLRLPESWWSIMETICTIKMPQGNGDYSEERTPNSSFSQLLSSPHCITFMVLLSFWASVFRRSQEVAGRRRWERFILLCSLLNCLTATSVHCKHMSHSNFFFKIHDENSTSFSVVFHFFRLLRP